MLAQFLGSLVQGNSAISPPTSDPARSTPNYSYQDVRYNRRKPNEIDQAAVQSSGAVFDYVKGTIETIEIINTTGSTYASLGRDKTPLSLPPLLMKT